MGLKWELIDKDGTAQINRAPIFGGWLVLVTDNVCNNLTSNGQGPLEQGYEWRNNLTFVPDPKHEWALE